MMQMLRVVMFAAFLGSMVADGGVAQQPIDFVGISAGMTMGDLHDPALDTDSRFGGTAGILTGIRPSRNTVVNLGAHWVQKGGGETRLDYLEIPLTVGGVALIQDGAYRSRFYTGLAMGVKLACNSEPPFLSCDDAARIEWVWPIGLLFSRWSSGDQFFALDIRYTESLSDAFESVVVSNRSWQLRLITGIQIGNGR